MILFYSNIFIFNLKILNPKIKTFIFIPSIFYRSDNPTAIISKEKANIVLRENNHFDASQTVVASNSDGADNFDCFVSFEGLPLNISAREEAANMDGDGSNGSAVVVNAQIILNSLFVVIVALLMF